LSEFHSIASTKSAAENLVVIGRFSEVSLLMAASLVLAFRGRDDIRRLLFD
jgi:hypothetical protein